MAIASGSRHSMGFITEAAFGVTPNNPAFKALRHVSTTLGLSKESLQSNELRADRQIADFRHGNKSITGDIGVELSYGSFDDLLEAVLGGTWAADTPSAGIAQLKAGIVRRSFSIERHFEDVDQYLRFTGVNFNTLSLSVAPNAMVTGTLGMMGKGMTTSATALSGSTYPAATTTSPFDSFTGTINENNSAIAIITDLSLNLDNGMSTTYVVGSSETLDPSIGRSNVTGSITAYFENTVLLNKFVNETETSIDFTLTDVAGNTYFFDLPRIKYNSGQPDVTDENPVTITFDFQALRDTTTATNILIQRNPV